MQNYPTHVRTIYGSLPEGRELAHLLSIVVEHDDDEFVVSEPRFHMHASASTEAEAIAAFRRVLSGYLDVLEEQGEKLGPSLQKQLTYLRSIMREVGDLGVEPRPTVCKESGLNTFTNLPVETF